MRSMWSDALSRICTMLLGSAQGADMVLGRMMGRAAGVATEIEHKADFGLVGNEHKLVVCPGSKQLSSRLGGGTSAVCTDVSASGADEAQGARGVTPCAFRKGLVRAALISVTRVRSIPRGSGRRAIC